MYKLNIYHQNVRGLRTKSVDFYRNLAKSNYDVITLTETWLVAGILDSELFDERYLVWRRDRDYASTSQSRGGGVLVAVRRDIVASESVSWQSNAEDIWISILVSTSCGGNVYRLHLCTLYLCEQHLGHSFSNQLYAYLDKLADLINDHPLDKFIILGDFNMSFIVWSKTDSGSGATPSALPSNLFSQLVDTLDLCGLKQFNLIHNKYGKILDLVLSNTMVSVSACLDPLILEDSFHPALEVRLEIELTRPLKANKRTVYHYSKGDYESIRFELGNIDWDDLLSQDSVDNALGKFYSELYRVTDLYIPKRLLKDSKYPPWYNSALIKILKEKYKYLCKFKVYGNISDHLTYQLLRERANGIEQASYKTYIEKLESSIGNCPKLFWSFIKSKRTNTNFPSSMSYDGNISDNGQGISELFASYFHSTFLASSSSGSCSNPMSGDYNCDINSIEVDLSMVRKQLKSLDLSKSAGPDAIPAIFIVNCANELTKPVSLLFKRSLSEGVVPTIWKSAFISPIHKKGAKDKVENYRPISKLCLLAKILERIVYNQLYSCLLPCLNPHQHGFLKGRSTVSNLILFTDFISERMDKGFQVDAIYTDYSKAFDRIDHNILLKKLLNLGISGDLYRWFTSYVLNRTQAVVLGGYTSSWMIIPSGVPQGSLLGPLLFVVFINDIGACFKYCDFQLFADDMKIFRSIQGVGDAELLQEDLLRVVNYCEINNLDLNIAKCLVISFTRKKHTIEYDYSISNQPLARSDVTRDLGVFIDNKLTYGHHIDHIAKKASSALGFIIRNASSFKTMKTVKILYCAYVRSHLEYASQVWSPYYAIHSSRLERIQKKFTRYLGYKFKIPRAIYEDRCARFHLLPLSTRRNIADMRYLMKVAQSKVDCSELLSKLSLNVPHRNSRIKNLLCVPFAKTLYRKNSFILRSFKTFNMLMKSDPTIDLFTSSMASVNKPLSLSECAMLRQNL